MERRNALKYIGASLVIATGLGAGVFSLKDIIDSSFEKEAAALFAQHQEQLARNGIDIGNTAEPLSTAFPFALQQFRYGFLMSIPDRDSLYVFIQQGENQNGGDFWFSRPLSDYQAGDHAQCASSILGDSFAPFFCAQSPTQQGIIGQPMIRENNYSGAQSAHQVFEQGEMFILPDEKFPTRNCTLVLSEARWRRMAR